MPRKIFENLVASFFKPLHIALGGSGHVKEKHQVEVSIYEREEGGGGEGGLSVPLFKKT